MPPGFAYPEGAQLWNCLQLNLDKRVRYLRVMVGRLRPGASAVDALSEFRAIGGEQYSVAPMKDSLVSDVRRPLLIFAGAVAFVLLIVWANLANLSLTRTESRNEEIALRAALGATPRRIVRQLLTESVVLSALGGVTGLLFATWAMPALLSMAPPGELPRVAEVRMSWTVAAFTFAIAVLTGIVFGFAPAAGVVRGPLRDMLNRSPRSLSRPGRLHGALVVSELALAVVLLTGAGLMIKSLIRLRSVELGFRPDHVVMMRLSLPRSLYTTAAAIRSLQSDLVDRFSSIPGVTAAACVDIPPLGDYTLRGPLMLGDGRTPPSDYVVENITVSPMYFRAMGIPVIKGRELTATDDANSLPVGLVSESVARDLWPHETPIGKRLSVSDKPQTRDWLTIVGVVKDIRQEMETTRRRRAVYQASAQAAPRVL